MVDELPQHVTRAVQAVWFEMQIVNKENNRASAISRIGCHTGVRDRRSGFGEYLILALGAGGDAFKKANRARLAVDGQLQLVGTQALNKMPLLIDHRKGALHQICTNTDHIVRGLLGLLLCGSAAEEKE